MKKALTILKDIVIIGPMFVGLLLLNLSPNNGGGVFPHGYVLIGMGISATNFGIFAILNPKKRGWGACCAILAGLLMIASPFIILATG